MFELRLKDLSESKRQEMLCIFQMRKELTECMGKCPHDEDRVPKDAICFHCDECWIAALENSFRPDKFWFLID